MGSPGIRVGCLAVAVLAAYGGTAWGRSTVSCGRITAVEAVTQESTRAQVGGAIVGGTLGAALGSGRLLCD